MPGPSPFVTRLFLSGSAGFLLIGVLGAANGAILPEFTRRFGLNDWSAGLFLTAGAVGAVAMVAAGIMGMRGLSARLSAGLMAAGAALVAASLAWPVTILGGLIAGAGFGITASHVNRAFLTGFGVRRGPAMVGLVNAISAAGLIVAPLILVAVGGSPAILYGGIALFALLCLALYPPHEDAFAGSARGLPPLGRRDLGLLGLITGTTVIENGLGGLGALAIIALGRPEAEALSLVSAYFTAYFLGRLALYWVASLVAPERLFLIAVLGAATGAALAAGGLVGTGYVMAGGFIGIAFPSAYVWQARLLGPDPRMAGAMVMAGLSGGVIGPALFGAVLGVTGFAHLFAMAAMLALVLAAAVLRAMRRAGAAGQPA
ncbi:MAG: hypothetical protein IT542_10355 [Rubellimicrobium sp.]|nr:hypothetical protein [Rubellimicrobium sp.]